MKGKNPVKKALDKIHKPKTHRDSKKADKGGIVSIKANFFREKLRHRYIPRYEKGKQSGIFTEWRFLI